MDKKLLKRLRLAVRQMKRAKAPQAAMFMRLADFERLAELLAERVKHVKR